MLSTHCIVHCMKCSDTAHVCFQNTPFIVSHKSEKKWWTNVWSFPCESSMCRSNWTLVSTCNNILAYSMPGVLFGILFNQKMTLNRVMRVFIQEYGVHVYCFSESTSFHHRGKQRLQATITLQVRQWMLQQSSLILWGMQLDASTVIHGSVGSVLQYQIKN